MNNLDLILKRFFQRFEEEMARIDALEDVVGIGEGHRVFGGDIYIQNTQPTAPGSWVWIDTTGINLLK